MPTTSADVGEPRWAELRGAWTRWIGRLGRALRYNSVERVQRNGETYYNRRRRRFAPLVVAVVNAMMRRAGDPCQVLPAPEWIERERRLHLRLYGRDLPPASGELLIPALPGEPAFSSVRRSPDLARKALAAAAQALAEIHRAGITHGDATLENVLYDEREDRARWIDFDTAHRPATPPAAARADDWRALSASAAEALRPADIVSAVSACAAAIPPETAALLERQSRRPTAFQAAQTAAESVRLKELAAALEARVGKSGQREKKAAED